MNEKRIFRSILFVGIVAIVAILAMAGNGNAIPTHGPVWIDENKNGSFDEGEWNGTSIQDAIDNASDGDIIYVWDGTYIENVNVNKRVTIIGNGSAFCKIVGFVKIDADDVTIDGFNITNSGNVGIYVSNGHKNIKIKNNTIGDIKNNYAVGIDVSYDCENITIEGNVIRNINGTDPSSGYSHGIILYGYYAKISNVSIADNEIYNVTSMRAAYGITLHSYCKNVTIDGNKIWNITAVGWSAGIVAWGAHLPAGVNAPMYVNITNNDIWNVTASYYGGAGIGLDYFANNVTIMRNNIRDNTVGIGLNGSVDLKSVEIHYNNIVGNSIYGLDNNISSVANATLNWWGAGSGPSNSSMHDPVTNEWANGTGDAIGGREYNNVHFDPWLRSEWKYGLVYDVTQDTYYGSIQPAIDNASDGDTIIVHDGIYDENVVIDKEVTVKAGSSPIIDGHGGTCVTINEDNVTLEGHILVNGSGGILITQDHNNITIKNNIIKYMGNGTTNAYGIDVAKCCANIT
ncbi:MAG: right-handed parallel beta-helix repeat-containing protein, partial [Thermoplasmata archaeon]|nr:right-handed parallel beta-helix repeat-containing protein [Thermoplasmata archaeon]